MITMLLSRSNPNDGSHAYAYIKQEDRARHINHSFIKPDSNLLANSIGQDGQDK